MSTVKIKWKTRNSISGTVTIFIHGSFIFMDTSNQRWLYIIEVTLKMKMIPYILAKMDKKWVVIVDI